MRGKQLGEGMHASVYKCYKVEDKDKKNPYAMKESITDDPEVRKAIKKEH